ncbi:MAG: inositol monophosphatase [Oligoflexia bacterium]|nr:inositol monophosphatase [Oligoflexia bacterium]
MSHKVELDAALSAAAQALLNRWPANPKALPLGLRYKADGSMVTEADLESNRTLVEVLTRLFPQDKIVSEEGPIARDIQSADRVWIIDPLDGTQSFVEGQQDFSILLALACGGTLQYGVLLLPARGQLAIANLRQGAFLDQVKLRVSTHDRIHHQALYLRHFSKIDDQRVFPNWVDSAEACLRLCRGELDAIVVRIKRHKQWDIAPFALLVQESGGRVSDGKGSDITFGGADLGCEYFVASNGLVHQEVLDFLQIHAGSTYP